MKARARKRTEQGLAGRTVSGGASEPASPGWETEAQCGGSRLPSERCWGGGQLCLFPLHSQSGRPPGLWPPAALTLPPLSPTGPAAGGGHGALPRRAVLGLAAEHLRLLQTHLQQPDSAHLCGLLQ